MLGVFHETRIKEAQPVSFVNSTISYAASTLRTIDVKQSSFVFDEMFSCKIRNEFYRSHRRTGHTPWSLRLIVLIILLST